MKFHTTTKVFYCLFTISIAFFLVLWVYFSGDIKEVFPLTPRASQTKLVYTQYSDTKHTEQYKVMTLTQMKFGPAFILSSTVSNSSDLSNLDTIHIYASMYDEVLAYSNVSCCMKFNETSNLHYFKIPVTNIICPLRRRRLTSYFYTCLNSKQGIIPDGVGITIDSLSCSERHVTYIQPFVPQKQQHGTTMALCNKGAYGNIKPELIIEWMETYRYLGVDKVVTYFLKDLNEAAKNVLLYYSHIGFVELYEFHPALEEDFPRIYHPSDKQSKSDRQMNVFDCHERMSGYTYFGIIDHDEFLIPTGNRTLKQLLADLYREHPTAAGFEFNLQPYFLPFGAYGTTNDLIIGQYITRVDRIPSHRAHKSIYQPKYIQSGGAHTHRPKPIDGRKRMMTSNDDGFIRHYRQSCYSKNCEKEGKRRNDTWMSNWSQRIEQNVKHVRKTVFGTEESVF